MKTTKKLFTTSLIALTAFSLNTAPVTAKEHLKIDKTTVGGPGTSRLCIREYGKTPAEAFAAGTKILAQADALLGVDKLHGNIRIRILPEQEKGRFVVEVYSVPYKKGSCPVKPEYLAAQVQQ